MEFTNRSGRRSGAVLCVFTKFVYLCVSDDTCSPLYAYVVAALMMQYKTIIDFGMV